jgi:hypothetical protein
VVIHPHSDSINLFVFQGAKRIEKKKVFNKNNSKKVLNALKYSKNLDGNEQDLLKNLSLTFETPVQLNDSFPIILCDTLNNKLAGYSTRIDSLHPEIIIIDYPWDFQTKFHLILPKESIKDSLNNMLSKADTIKFVTKSESAYGACVIRVNGYDQNLNQVLQLVQDDKIKFSYPITSSVLNIKLLPPGEYVLKLLYDTNKNGIWDTGSYYGKPKKQPEIVKLLSIPLNIRANWENELNLIINK